MDRHLEPPAAGTESWISRTHDGLRIETLAVVYLLALSAALMGLRALFTLRRCVKDMAANPSDRAQTYADCNERVKKCTQRQWFISNIYLLHAMAIWLVDASVGVWAIYNDVDANPEQYNAQIWIDLAIHSVSMLAIFMGVFFIFPLGQIMVVGSLIRRFGTTRATLADYAPEVRILSTHIAQLWAMLGFMIIAWWPVLDHTFYRLVICEAVFGSATVWQHISFAFNFRSEQLHDVELQPLLGVRDGVKLFGQQIVATHTKTVDGLPSYQAVPQSLDGKTEL
ncbi:hypothetical protein CLAFUW4_00056 [Fulvia fulva]|uniref:Uncharacterized protein n=1 Tax=Passalora fulva TaxID=5499 RepID=A0A9Q8P4B0_PASFU|nr:uncharacterized protein CLAFUR5_00054 [Fulvia fulva]KAK4634503.1 hypothetical protein CLAFUR4_00055 [Fulvia fulva]KAK4636721.1 hypothetical protein CLAFUR0_00054 [Fulvia fulva]UJO12631.1 hypothetical protein CLAFUR5_00054 [Fulvia fulva]WPV08294.1 hypothetical protein CLAFUW4_00056 [Fulvia fulva]WPV24638.1 hypothetical protein CLAFUW7_00056 [Fulvia fulva]